LIWVLGSSGENWWFSFCSKNWSEHNSGRNIFFPNELLETLIKNNTELKDHLQLGILFIWNCNLLSKLLSGMSRSQTTLWKIGAIAYRLQLRPCSTPCLPRFIPEETCWSSAPHQVSSVLPCLNDQFQFLAKNIAVSVFRTKKVPLLSTE
jgi:hypothetical protein